MFEESPPESIEEKLETCQGIIGYDFQDAALLECCLTHASVARTRLESNERHEFLGDAILGMVVCELLFSRFPEYPEGELTRLKSSLVSRNTCATIAERLELEQCLLLGKGLATHNEIPSSILAAAFEALIAGVYLDGGLDEARKFIVREIEEELEVLLESSHGKNFKSILQQISQKTYGEPPLYRLLDEKGPDHLKCFKVSAVVGHQVFPAAWGSNKKEAEQRAAQNALHQIEEQQALDPAD